MVDVVDDDDDDDDDVVNIQRTGSLSCALPDESQDHGQVHFVSQNSVFF